MSNEKRAASKRNIEDRLRSAAPASRYSGTIARGTATGPDPYISELRRKVARGDKLESAKHSRIEADESTPTDSARKKVSGQ